MKKTLFVTLAIFSLTACDREETYDVQYYRDNAEIRISTIEECKNNPGELRNNPNCVNALEAEHREIINPENTGMPSIK